MQGTLNTRLGRFLLQTARENVPSSEGEFVSNDNNFLRVGVCMVDVRACSCNSKQTKVTPQKRNQTKNRRIHLVVGLCVRECGCVCVLMCVCVCVCVWVGV